MNNEVSNHFIRTDKMVNIGSQTKRKGLKYVKPF